jgi:restriction system protein
VSARNCIYCRTKLIRFPSRQAISAHRRLIFQLSLCACCGWWSVYRVHQGEHPETPEFECYAGAIGCLKELDLTDISIPLAEVRSYLAAKSDRLTQIHPKRFEDVVCSVFSDLGWHARVTAYSGDGGIDVILDGPSKKPIGVQVKRSGKHRRGEAEQIRALAGAMLVNGMTKGIFVTTSSFRRGARTTAAQLGSIGYGLPSSARYCPTQIVQSQSGQDNVSPAQ